MESIKFIQDRSFKLIVAGGGDIAQYDSLIEKNIDVLEIHNEDIPDEEVAQYFERSEFVVLPYKDATASGIIPVAYAFGKPVIATRVGTIPDYVDDQRT